MIALLQRVSHASVTVAGECVAHIEVGLAVLVGVEKSDTAIDACDLLQRLLSYRVFADSAGRMNLSLKDIGGALLLVPQFTLAAETRKGLRPSFSSSAAPGAAREMFEHLVEAAVQAHDPVRHGLFGAHMQLNLTNDGPVTFWLESQRRA